MPKHDFNLYNKGRVEIIKQAMRDMPIIYNAASGNGFTDVNCYYLVLACMNQMPGSVHSGMFIKCLEIMGTDEQHKIYLEKAKKYEIIGCYAQT